MEGPQPESPPSAAMGPLPEDDGAAADSPGAEAGLPAAHPPAGVAQAPDATAAEQPLAEVQAGEEDIVKAMSRQLSRLSIPDAADEMVATSPGASAAAPVGLEDLPLQSPSPSRANFSEVGAGCCGAVGLLLQGASRAGVQACCRGHSALESPRRPATICRPSSFLNHSAEPGAVAGAV